MKIQFDKTYTMDCLEFLRMLPDNFVHCCVTSPPYWNLRNYEVTGQIGLESTLGEYVKKLTSIFNEVRRVLRPDGTLWLNLGDSYAARSKNRTRAQATKTSGLSGGLLTQCQILQQQNKVIGGLKRKDLCGIPWRVAFALQEDGWYLRSDIIWSKPNPMPESVTDRPTKSHEYIFLMTKSPHYYYNADAIAEKISDASMRRYVRVGKFSEAFNRLRHKHQVQMAGHKAPPQSPMEVLTRAAENVVKRGTRNKRSVWMVPTQNFPDAHFAVYPERLIKDCVLAGCPRGGLVLDPFMGAGTTAVVAKKLSCNFIGSELNPKYVEIAEKRLANEHRLF